MLSLKLQIYLRILLVWRINDSTSINFAYLFVYIFCLITNRISLKGKFRFVRPNVHIGVRCFACCLTFLNIELVPKFNIVSHFINNFTYFNDLQILKPIDLYFPFGIYQFFHYLCICGGLDQNCCWWITSLTPATCFSEVNLRNIFLAIILSHKALTAHTQIYWVRKHLFIVFFLSKKKKGVLDIRNYVIFQIAITFTHIFCVIISQNNCLNISLRN